MSRVVVIGATGNVGTSLVAALGGDDSVDEIVGVARRRAALDVPKTTWVAANIESDDLVALCRGADCVVHLAWRIQPSHDIAALRRTNVVGSSRVFRAVADAGVPALVYASSVGAYSAGPKDRAVDESWPTDGTPTSFYARHKAEVERLLDRFEHEQPQVRVVRLRPGLIFKRESAAEQRRYFLGPLFPRFLAQRETIPFVPDLPRLRFQAVHSHDVGEAYRLAAVGDVRGAFNIAADPVLDARGLAHALHARTLRLEPSVVRAATLMTWRLRLQPTPPGWLDMALAVPVMDIGRAHEELGWTPARSSVEAMLDALAGMREDAGLPTPPLNSRAAPPPGRSPAAPAASRRR
jgi:nucleoside-diphosphate-sugar epimerase